MTREIEITANAEELAQHVAQRFLTVVADVLKRKERADVALTGGTIAMAVYRELAARSAEIDVARLDLWWGDERYVAADDPDRNAGQAREAFAGTFDAATWHDMPAAGEHATAAEAARAYAAELGPRQLDVVLLGVGPDGHCASIFPGHPSAQDDGDVVAVHDAPKPPPERLSLTPGRLGVASQVWFVASGTEKAAAVAGLLGDDESLPCARVHGRDATRVFLDEAAQSG